MNSRLACARMAASYVAAALLAIAMLAPSLAAAQIVFNLGFIRCGYTQQGRLQCRPSSRAGDLLRTKPSLNVGADQSCLPECDYYLGTSLSVTVQPIAGNGNNGSDASSVYSWSFSESAVGQFANGDYWVAPVDLGGEVSIAGLSGSDTVRADESPTLENNGLLPGYGNYNSSKTLQWPKSYTQNSVIVAAIQRDEAGTSSCGTSAILGSCVDSYQVLTVLSEIPIGAGRSHLRPPIYGGGATPELLDNYDLSLVPSLAYLSGASDADLERIARRWRHTTDVFSIVDSAGVYYSEGGRAYRSHTLVDDYASGRAKQFTDDLMLLWSAATTGSGRDEALASILTYGRDLHSAAVNGDPARYYGSGAGQFTGFIHAVAFVAALDADGSMLAGVSSLPSHMSATANLGPQELDQINADIAATPIWGDYAATQHLAGYWANLFEAQCYDGATGECNSSLGPKTHYDPHRYIDGPATLPGSAYFEVSHAAKKSLVAMMCAFPEMAEAVNYDPLVSYVDRVGSHGVLAGSDPCAPPDPREPEHPVCDPWDAKFSVGGAAEWQAASGCQYLGETWGPDPADISKCIANNSGGNTGQAGRFPARDGFTPTFTYTSAQIEANYQTMRGESATCRSVQ